jgi:hypothetical protein
MDFEIRLFVPKKIATRLLALNHEKVDAHGLPPVALARKMLNFL